MTRAVQSNPAENLPKVSGISPAELRRWLWDGDEIALLDVRETGVSARDGHILLSVTLPLSQVEFRIATLVPRKQTRIVVYDSGDGVLATRATRRIAALGYVSLKILAGGAAAWQAAGYTLFTGSHVIGKAFGEVAEHVYGTPHLSVHEVRRRLDAGENIVLVDSRPESEFRSFSIPGAIDLPGAEIVYRFHAAVADPNALVVVNCAGRTRSIIGAQALINAGVPNQVVSLANGTMDWVIAGFALDHGKSNPGLTPTGAALDRAKKSAARLIRRFGIPTIDRATLEIFKAEHDEGRRSLYLLDVRGEDEFAAGHMPGSHAAPGGQLVQQVGHWVGTRHARIVLIDGADQARAAITASWLIQINWAEVFLLADALEGELVAGAEPGLLATEPPDIATVTPADLKRLLDSQAATVIDLDDSQAYRRGHIPGAHFAIRANLAADIGRLPGVDILVLTSADDRLARFAAADLAGLTSRPVRVLAGGTAAWRAAGLALASGDGTALHAFEDLALSAWTLPEQERLPAFRTYLDWELSLVGQIERDGTARFRLFPPETRVEDARAAE